jgi:hypothetical protein
LALVITSAAGGRIPTDGDRDGDRDRDRDGGGGGGGGGANSRWWTGE